MLPRNAFDNCSTNKPPARSLGTYPFQLKASPTDNALADRWQNSFLIWACTVTPWRRHWKHSYLGNTNNWHSPQNNVGRVPLSPMVVVVVLAKGITASASRWDGKACLQINKQYFPASVAELMVWRRAVRLQLQFISFTCFFFAGAFSS